MRAYWTDKRANGQPIEPGTFARVLDLEDGTNPIFVYGRTETEVFEKIERNNLNAQATLARRATAQPQSAPAQGAPQTTVAAPRRGLTADQVMQYTADLQNPAKAGAAIAALHADATGTDPAEQAKQQFASLFAAWEGEHPEYYPHPGNRHTLATKALGMAGLKPALVTREILTQCYNEALAAGLLFEEPATQTQEPPPTNPGESPALRTERPRLLRSTGMRSTNYRAPQTTTQTRTLKYTKEQILRMPIAKAEKLNRDNDKDYAEACDFYFGQQATA